MTSIGIRLKTDDMQFVHKTRTIFLGTLADEDGGVSLPTVTLFGWAGGCSMLLLRAIPVGRKKHDEYRNNHLNMNNNFVPVELGLQHSGNLPKIPRFSRNTGWKIPWNEVKKNQGTKESSKLYSGKKPGGILFKFNRILQPWDKTSSVTGVLFDQCMVFNSRVSTCGTVFTWLGLCAMCYST